MPMGSPMRPPMGLPMGSQIHHPMAPPMMPQMLPQMAAQMPAAPFMMPQAMGQQMFAPQMANQFPTSLPMPPALAGNPAEPVPGQVQELLDDYDSAVDEPSIYDPTPRRTDFIHICDSYPPIILEALDRERDRGRIIELDSSGSDSEDSTSSALPSSSSSPDSGTTHSLPRPFISRTIPRAALQFPQYPQFQRPSWDEGPTSHPRDWMGVGGFEGGQGYGQGRGLNRYAPRESGWADGWMSQSNAPRLPPNVW
ncbi:hypothetical protein BS50DRAFT_567013 [Corynespora cassiicola Philippines]|uniref:Uncharacterized protein n=1 Tax=Corynespora cassiicola Philippines TaxID=1448308 RepID=A0A2T2P8Y8_CORCC|nr:hypothetical protein BS50DRAFT_567013 [Corynespora cassiicola Philippines]